MNIFELILRFGGRLLSGHVIDILNIFSAIFWADPLFLILADVDDFGPILIHQFDFVHFLAMLPFNVLDLFLILQFLLLELRSGLC